MPARERNVGNGYGRGRGSSIPDHNQLPPEPVQHSSDHQPSGFNGGFGRGSGRSNSSQNQLPYQPVQHSSDHQPSGFNGGFGRGRGRSNSSQNQLPPQPVQHSSDHQPSGFNGGFGRGSGRSNSSQNQLPYQPVQHSSDHQRSGFNGGFGRGSGRSNSSQNQLPPQPEQRRSDGNNIFMVAGRLAAEYLASRGAIPHTALSSERPNSNFRNQAGQSSRSQEAAPVDISAPVADTRSHLDGSSSLGSRNNLERRRAHGYDLDFMRRRSWSERSNVADESFDKSSVDLARKKRSHSH